MVGEREEGRASGTMAAKYFLPIITTNWKQFGGNSLTQQNTRPNTTINHHSTHNWVNSTNIPSYTLKKKTGREKYHYNKHHKKNPS